MMSMVFSLRFSPSLYIMAFILGGLLGFFLLGDRFGEWMNGMRKSKREAGADGEFGQRVSERLYDCRQREERFRDEGERILKSIATLRDDLSRNDGAADDETGRAEEVIKELESEFSLRHAKASFFADCAEKLEKLLARHRLVESIAARRRELREMRRDNYDDEATVEETRFNIEQDSIELDTIVELSQSATATTDKRAQTQDLRKRLDQLRQQLNQTGDQQKSSPS